MSVECSYTANCSLSSMIYAEKLNRLVKDNNLSRYVERVRKDIKTEEENDDNANFDKVMQNIFSLNLSVIYISTSQHRYESEIIAFHPIEKIVLSIMWSDPSLTVEGYGDDIAAIEKLTKDFLDLFPEEEEEEDLPEESVSFRFWHKFNNNASAYDKVQECPGLESMRKNYNPKVIASLENLRTMEKPDEKGKVIIWHGKPGGGKTYAVRALARDWAYHKGASIEIILDPHAFLEDMAYMRQVILSRPNYRENAVDQPNNPIRLIILEDHAELFTTKCRESKGLSTILNLTDGILGKDLRLIFLLTANEDIKEIDPAIKRPRRCIGITEFSGFTRDEALSWSEDTTGEFKAKLDSVYPDDTELTLVQLYHIQDLIQEEKHNESDKELLLQS